MAKSPVKFIKPRKLRMNQYQNAIKSGFRDSIAVSKELFGMSYKDWDKENQPSFETGPLQSVGGNLEQEYSTDSKIYNIVNSGAPPHPIEAKGGKFMKFRSGFKAKTVPGVLTSFSQPPPSGQWNTKSHVDHPGIEARNFPKPVVEVVQPFFAEKIESAGKVL